MIAVILCIIVILIIYKERNVLVRLFKSSILEKPLNYMSKDIGENTSGNFLNESRIAFYKEWAYLTCYPNDRSKSLGMYKVKLDGEEKGNIISEKTASYINVSNDKIYFLNAYNTYVINDDGMDLSEFKLESPCLRLLVSDGCIYYAVQAKASYCELYKSKLDSKKKIRVTEDLVGYFYATKGYIYYTSSQYVNCFNKLDAGTGITYSVDWKDKISSTFGVEVDEKFRNPGLFRINSDGKEKIKISDNVEKFMVDGNFIYFINIADNYRLYRMNIDGSNKILIHRDRFCTFNIADGFIFYTRYITKNKITRPKELYRIDLQGRNRVRLCKKRVERIYVYEGWVYFDIDEDKSIMRVKTDAMGEQDAIKFL